MVRRNRDIGAHATNLDFEIGDLVIGHRELGGNEWFGVTQDGAMADVFAVAQDVCLRHNPAPI
jgi:hypothetical protein